MTRRIAVVSAWVLTGAWLATADARPQPPPQQRQQQQQQQQQPPQLRDGQRGRGAEQRPERDRNRPVVTGTASLSGRVLSADTGRPLKRARVIAAGGGRPLSTTTDDQGRYQLANLPAASYSITASKAGYVDAIYGQRRALRAGTPVRLADGQQLANVDLKLPRGGVITGRLADEDGEPLARAVVSVLRYQYVRGERQLTAAGADQTDDRGQYRVFGLPPGEYYVSASVGGLIEPLLRSVVGAAAPPPGDAVENVGYAPTYYPGALGVSDAARVKLELGQEAAGIDFQVRLVTLATVRGVVYGSNAMVVLVPEGGTLGGGGRGGGRGGLAELATGLLRAGQTLRATTQADGTFVIRNVPPGSYTVVARSDVGSGSPRTAAQSVVVMGGDVQVALTPAPGVSLSGAVTLESSGGTLPALGGFRVNPAPLGAAVSLPRGGRSGTPNDRGEFTIADLMPGRYLLRATGPRGWILKSVYVDGREVTDQAIEIKGDHVSGVNLIFTDRIATIAGTVRDARGGPAASVTVVVFADDERLWYPQSRHVAAARTEANGTYRVTGLPAGRYLAVAVEDVEQGEWFDPAFLEQVKGAATRLVVGEGEQKTQDLKAPA